MEWQIQLFNSVPLEVSIILWIVFLVLKFDMVALHVHPLVDLERIMVSLK